MKRLLQIALTVSFAAALVVVLSREGLAFGQGPGSAKPPADGKAAVQGYTRTNKHTGLPEQVRPHKRHPPAPKPVPVQPYTRGGKPVEGHQRRPPAPPADPGAPH